jgi:very-short-patch-repair endonuclease
MLERMQPIHEMVRQLGGAAQKQQLVKLGATDHALTIAVRNRSVLRARQGWYTVKPESDPEVHALRVGGRLTGLSALQAMGAWVDAPRVLHVSLRPNAARLRSQHDRWQPLSRSRVGIRLHWDDRSTATRGTTTCVALEDALIRVVLDEPWEIAVAALDWARHSGALSDFEVLELVARLPERFRGIAGWTDAGCASLPESLARTRFRMRGLAVRTQVPVAELMSIDIVVEECVAFEVDGEEFHRDRFARDRAKDLAISLTGMHAMRPSASLVFGRWPEVLRSVELALAARRVRASRAAPRIPARRASAISGNSGNGHARRRKHRIRTHPRE